MNSIRQTATHDDQENPLSTLPARKQQISSRRPLQDILPIDNPEPSEPEIQEENQEVVAEETRIILVEFDICSGKFIQDDYRDILCPSKQTQLSNKVWECKTPPPYNIPEMYPDLI